MTYLPAQILSFEHLYRVDSNLSNGILAGIVANFPNSKLLI